MFHCINEDLFPSTKWTPGIFREGEEAKKIHALHPTNSRLGLVLAWKDNTFLKFTGVKTKGLLLSRAGVPCPFLQPDKQEDTEPPGPAAVGYGTPHPGLVLGMRRGEGGNKGWHKGDECCAATTRSERR